WGRQKEIALLEADDRGRDRDEEHDRRDLRDARQPAPAEPREEGQCADRESGERRPGEGVRAEDLDVRRKDRARDVAGNALDPFDRAALIEGARMTRERPGAQHGKVEPREDEHGSDPEEGLARERTMAAVEQTDRHEDEGENDGRLLGEERRLEEREREEGRPPAVLAPALIRKDREEGQ